MAKKITLTVPDGLYKKIDEWRSAFNMSRIFQDAVSEAIRRKEDVRRRVGEESGLGEIIQRLKQEKSHWEETLRHKGERGGQEWASRAHYEDLVLAVSVTPEQILRMPHMAQPLREALDQLEPFSALMSQKLENVRAAFAEGWKKGINDFWEMVRDKI